MVQVQPLLADSVWVATSLLQVGVFKSPRHCIVVRFSLQRICLCLGALMPGARVYTIVTSC